MHGGALLVSAHTKGDTVKSAEKTVRPTDAVPARTTKTDRRRYYYYYYYYYFTSYFRNTSVILGRGVLRAPPVWSK